jgi:hypothetical protein
MLFFRSEEHVRRWCDVNNSPLRPIVNLEQLWFLSTTWYGNRLTVESRRPRPAEMTQIFASIGLHGDFWDPASDRF